MKKSRPLLEIFFRALGVVSARRTREWFMYGKHPYKLKDASGPTVKWRRRYSREEK